MFSEKPHFIGLYLALFSMAIGVTTPVKAAADWESNLSPVERFVKFVTDVPPIDNLICSLESRHHGKSIHQMRYRPSTRLYQWPENAKVPPPFGRFRYKPAAFFCRDLRSLEEIDLPMDIPRKAVGVWEDDYWFLDTGMGAQNNLHLYRYEPNDWNNALAGYSSYMIMFGVFTSFGLSGSGPGCVVPGKSTPLEVVFSGKRYPVVLEIENGIPVQAKHKMTLNGPKGHYDVDVTLSYSYDTNIAPLGIPSQFIFSLGPATNRIHKIELAEPKQPLPKDIFMPDGILTNPALVRMVRTNRHDYYIDKKGQWQRMDKSPAVAIAELEGRHSKNRLYYFILAALFTILLAPVIVARVKNKAKTQQ